LSIAVNISPTRKAYFIDKIDSFVEREIDRDCIDRENANSQCLPHQMRTELNRVALLVTKIL
jgi:hypothetical protein